jgi:hypothetical protein
MSQILYNQPVLFPGLSAFALMHSTECANTAKKEYIHGYWLFFQAVVKYFPAAHPALLRVCLLHYATQY